MPFGERRDLELKSGFRTNTQKNKQVEPNLQDLQALQEQFGRGQEDSQEMEVEQVQNYLEDQNVSFDEKPVKEMKLLSSTI